MNGEAELIPKWKLQKEKWKTTMNSKNLFKKKSQKWTKAWTIWMNSLHTWTHPQTTSTKPQQTFKSFNKIWMLTLRQSSRGTSNIWKGFPFSMNKLQSWIPISRPKIWNWRLIKTLIRNWSRKELRSLRKLLASEK